MKKGFAPVLIIILVILTLVAAVIGLRFYDQKYNNWKEEGPPILTKDHLASLPSPTTQDQTANWKTYKSDKSGWQISYPGDYRIINGGKSCAIPGGSPGDENTFCFAKLSVTHGAQAAIEINEIRKINPTIIICAKPFFIGI